MKVFIICMIQNMIAFLESMYTSAQLIIIRIYRQHDIICMIFTIFTMRSRMHFIVSAHVDRGINPIQCTVFNMNERNECKGSETPT